MIHVLFVCIHNSARSQMAEAFLNQLAGDRYQAQSAGLEAGQLNPRVVRAMQELSIDISANRAKTVQEMLETQQKFDYVITVCDAASAERCPLFPGIAERRSWSFPDPAALSGSEEQIMDDIRTVRDQIHKAILDFIAETTFSGAEQ